MTTTEQLSNEAIKQQIANTYKRIASSVPNFKDRPQQKKLINAIASVISLDEKAALIGEAPTGVGKSLAIILGSLPFALNHNKKLVISTATTALQDQLMFKDLPTFAQSYEQPFTFIALKGRTRYLCPKRLSKASIQDGDDVTEQDTFDSALFSFKPTENDIQTIASISDKFNTQEWDGDRDNLDIAVHQPLWATVSTDSNGCNGRKCEMYKECPYYIKKGQAKSSDVIVINHDFLLSDIAIGTEMLLPSYEETIFVLDEAHHLPSKAISSSVNTLSIKYNANSIAKAEAVLKKIRSALPSFTFDSSVAIELSLELSKHLNDVYAFMSSHKSMNDKNNQYWIFENSLFPKEATPIVGQILSLSDSLNAKLKSLAEDLDLFIKERDLSSDANDKLLADISYLSGFSTNVNYIFTTLTEAETDPPLAKWAEFNKKQTDISLNVSRVDVSQYLFDNFISSAYKMIFLSATISTLGNFDSFSSKVGLNQYKNIFNIKLDSPFDFKKSTLYLPKIKSDSNDVVNHSVEVAQIINTEPTDEVSGTLCIFTSRKKLNAVYELLTPEIKSYCILQDGSLSKNAMINIHKQNIDEGRHSIILGLTSFSEGVDLPNHYCTHVLLDKLPFASIQEPQLVTLSNYLEKNGRNPFMEISLPDAYVKLTQIVGRLIRTELDFGKITICDNRLQTKQYAKKMINSLPPFTLVS